MTLFVVVFNRKVDNDCDHQRVMGQDQLVFRFNHHCHQRQDTKNKTLLKKTRFDHLQVMTEEKVSKEGKLIEKGDMDERKDGEWW